MQVQYLTFTAIECDAGDCIGDRGGTVQFLHNGNLGSEVNLATGTASEIAASFTSIADRCVTLLALYMHIQTHTYDARARTHARMQIGRATSHSPTGLGFLPRVGRNALAPHRHADARRLADARAARTAASRRPM